MKLLKKMTGILMFLALGISSCTEEVEVKNSLSVSPDNALEFKASGNESVTLTVTTDAEKWSFTAPDWIKAEQSGNTLSVNVADNSGDARNGSIEFTAGTADMVKVNVLQHSSDGDDEVEEGKIAGSIADESGDNEVKITLDEETKKATVKLKLTFDTALESDADISVFVDKEYIDEYNYTNETFYVQFPDEALNSVEWSVIVPKGTTKAELSIDIDATALKYFKYLLPLKVKTANGDIAFPKKESRVNYIIYRIKHKEIKQMCIMEFNDVNPLNVLEYKLEDGSYFFDALVLFSGNLGWDAGSGKVRFNARTGEPVINYNTDALIREWKTYIKPIHDAGIKVYMGILPHHTQAGITTLSQNGCMWFAQEMAEIIKDCQMDGVFLDEEYLGNDGGVMAPEWGDPYNRTDGSYFAYQMSKQMDAVCDWPTEVAVYTYGLPVDNWTTISDHENPTLQVTVPEYADITVGDYGLGTSPLEGQTKKNCTGASLELKENRGSIDENEARRIKNDGYGWIMYFAFNPDPEHELYNLPKSLDFFRAAARGCYDLNLVEPTHYYKKIDEGVYDPKKYELN